MRNRGLAREPRAGVGGAGGDPWIHQAWQDWLCRSSATSSALGNGTGSCEILWEERSAPAKGGHVGVIGFGFLAVERLCCFRRRNEQGSRVHWNKEFSCAPWIKWLEGINSWFDKGKELIAEELEANLIEPN